MNYKKYLIFGGGGMLGRSFLNLLPESQSLFTDKDLTSPRIQFCDIRDFIHTRKVVESYDPDIIINLAAVVDLEYAEKNSQDCFITNYAAALHLFQIAEERDIPYIFISTAGIFGNQMEYYTETDTPTPLSVYGRSKYLMELFLESQKYEKWWVFRAGWMMGGGKEFDKKFVNKVYKQIQSGATTLNVVDDKLGTPTYTHDFASSIIRHLSEDLPYGLYNQVGGGEASRYDVAVEMVSYLGLKTEVKKVDSNFFTEEYFAPRPFSEKLVNEKLQKLGRNYMRDWKECLHEYLDEHYR